MIVFGCYVQLTGKHGKIMILKTISNRQNNDVKLIVGADLLSLAVLEEPAHQAEVVVGTSQRFGIPLGYGGPHAGYFEKNIL